MILFRNFKNYYKFTLESIAQNETFYTFGVQY